MKRLFLTIIFSLLLATLFASQFFSDQAKAKQKLSEPIVLKSQIVERLDLGLDNAAADMAWLSSIQYFGGRTTAQSPKLPDYLYLASDLDPNFSYPYAFAALILPSIGETDKAIDLAKKGVDLKLPDWRIPYYLAATYHINKQDSKSAAYYFDIAANTKGAPETVSKVAARYGIGKDKRDQTKQIWIGIYESTKDEVVKERAQRYIIHFELMNFMEESIGQYEKKYGKPPANIEDLVSGKILKEIPLDPFGFNFSIDESGKLVLK